jgi:hypothetical protein
MQQWVSQRAAGPWQSRGGVAAGMRTVAMSALAVSAAVGPVVAKAGPVAGLVAPTPVKVSPALVRETDASVRAAASWQALLNDQTSVDGRLLLTRERNGERASVWTLGQTLHAALDQARLNGDYRDYQRLVRQLDDYQLHDGYPGLKYAATTNGGQGEGEPFSDDNAWLGLVFAQAAQQAPTAEMRVDALGRARGIFTYLQSQIQPNGDLYWQRGQSPPTVNTCSLGPTIELALRLQLLDGGGNVTAASAGNSAGGRPQTAGNAGGSYLQTAQQLHTTLDKLRLPSGLYADHYRADDGSVEQSVYSYNQGTPLGAQVLMYRATGDASWLDRAKQTAGAALQYYGADDASGNRFYQQPPVFNAIFLRNLANLASAAAAPDERYGLFTAAYANRAWMEGRHPDTGLFEPRAAQALYDEHYLDHVPPPIGSYGNNDGWANTLDQAGLVQLYSLQAWPANALPNAT